MSFVSVSDIPELLKDWSYELNEKSPERVPAKSIMRFMWTSNLCGHTWTDYPKGKMLSNRGCRICSGEEILAGYNDFKTLHPDLLTRIKNSNSLPNDLNPFSDYRVVMVCDLGHEFSRTLGKLVRSADKCPVCLNKTVLIGFNDLASRFPEISKEFHPNLNHPNTPETVFCYRRELAWWVCARSHEWEMRVDARTGQNQGCPYCSGRLAVPGETDLATKFPEVSADWDYALNGDLAPTSLKPFAHKFVWWKCPEGHSSYRQQVSKRTKRGTGCPECSIGRGSSKGEFELAKFLTSLEYDYVQGSRKFLKGMEIDLFIESERKGVEYNGEWMHSNNALKPDSKDSTFRDYHLRKLAQAEASDVDLVFVWEHDWIEHRDEVELSLCQWLYTGTRSPLLDRLVSYKDTLKSCCDVRV